MRKLAALVMVGFTAMSAGCVLLAATAAGTGAVGLAYANGLVSETFDAPIEEVGVAVKSAIRDLELPLEYQNVTRDHGEIDSRDGTNRQIQIDLDRVAQPIPSDPPKTKVGIRVVAFGDKEISRRILDQIQHRLRNPAPPELGTPMAPSPDPPPPLQTDEPPMAR